MLYTPDLHIDGADSLPIYSAIYEAMKRDMLSGKLRPHDRLPSIRTLARHLSVSITPVETAYQQLVAEGFAESQARRGYFVVPLPESYGGLSLAGTNHDQILPEAEQIQTYAYDFHIAKNDITSFPIEDWKRLLSQVVRQEYQELLFYGDAQGEAGLRNELALYLHRFRGVNCRKEQIVVAAEQHLLVHYLSLLMKDLPPVLAVENPCYPLIPAAFRSRGYHVATVTERDGGICYKRLKESGARVIALAPSHQFPGGRIMPAPERLDILNWSKASGGYIIEDDYGGEFRYNGQPISALQGIEPSVNVIYLGGFSQVLAPDLCIHYMVLPESLLEPFQRLKKELRFEGSSSRILQRTLQLFMEKGHFERHVRKMRAVYRSRSRILSESLRHYFQGNGDVQPADSGMHVILKMNASVSEAVMAAEARRNGLHVSQASLFYKDPTSAGPENRFLIGFGGIPLERIEEGIRKLRKVWEPYL